MRKSIFLGALALILMAAGPAAAQQQQPTYTRAEYDDYNAAANEKNLPQRIKLLDAFVAKYPESTMLKPYIYPAYLSTAGEAFQAKSYSVARDAADRFLGLQGTEPTQRFQMMYLRTLSFQQDWDGMAGERATKANQIAKEGLQLLTTIAKPEQMSPADWDKQQMALKIQLNFTIGTTAQAAKNYVEADQGFSAMVELNPQDAATNYRLGLVKLQLEPPQYIDGFWALARAIALKVPGEAKVRDYLRSQVLRYQNTQCDTELDRQVNEMIALAGQSPKRPADYSIPSDAELTKERSPEKVAQFLETLKVGGPEAKKMWLAVCGLEFPDVAVKVIEVADNGESTTMKVYRPQATEQQAIIDEMNKATEPNMELRIAEQPEAKRLKKDDFVRFTGTLAEFQPEPFLLSWNQAKINPEDIPAEEEGPAKRAPAKKRPGRASR